MSIHHTERLRTLADDWDRYARLPDPEWCRQMQSAVAMEMQTVVHELAREVAPELFEPPKRKRWWVW